MPALLTVISAADQSKQIIELSYKLGRLLNYEPIITTCNDRELCLKKQLESENYEVSGSEKDFFQAISAWLEKPSLDISLITVSQKVVNINKTYKATRFFSGCRMLKIPYLILPEKVNVSWHPKHIFFPVCTRDGEKEASAWVGSWTKANNSEITILHPEFRSKENQGRLWRLLVFIQRLFDNSNVPYKTIKAGAGKKETNNKALEEAKKTPDSLLIVPATRLNSPEYIFTGPPEIRLLKNRGNTPVLFVNPRHDMYVPCS
ncbi:hypothetical protein [Anaerophaga thermohalophila]|jgi:hypothetical protein|uniref:hypothetical protein n=1 Tax=Anaerophaga thermohalophila TaxID=177400 RepID=UPI0002DBB0CD|nr:hypothetical protein [Anaerophaga thermohalophila]